MRSALVCVFFCLTGQVITDAGATATVACQHWVRPYTAALMPQENAALRTEQVDVNFRCRDGVGHSRRELAVLPISIFGGGYQLRVHVVPVDLPLLLGLDCLWRARAVLDLEENTLFLKDSGLTVPLAVNKAGRLALVVLPHAAPRPSAAISALVAGVELSSGSSSTTPSPAIGTSHVDLSGRANRLHRTYGHAAAARLSHKLHTAVCSDAKLLAALEAAVTSCQACELAQPAPHHPVVSLHRSSRVNETIAMDLAGIRGLGTLAHFIDLRTRLLRCVAIHNKLTPTVVVNFLTRGYPSTGLHVLRLAMVEGSSRATSFGFWPSGSISP